MPIELRIFQIVILILSVVIHEVSHGYAAEKLGDPTARLAGRLTLNPLKHLDMFGSVILPLLLIVSGSPFVIGWAKPVPYNPYNLRNAKWGEALVAGSGPLSNILIAIFFGLLLRFGTFIPEAAVLPLVVIVLINLVLAVFNLVPIPPLDGSKILFWLLPRSAERVRFALERYGLILVLIFVIFFWQYISPIIEFLFEMLVGSPFI